MPEAPRTAAGCTSLLSATGTSWRPSTFAISRGQCMERRPEGRGVGRSAGLSGDQAGERSGDSPARQSSGQAGGGGAVGRSGSRAIWRPVGRAVWQTNGRSSSGSVRRAGGLSDFARQQSMPLSTQGAKRCAAAREGEWPERRLEELPTASIGSEHCMRRLEPHNDRRRANLSCLDDPGVASAHDTQQAQESSSALRVHDGRPSTPVRVRTEAKKRGINSAPGPCRACRALRRSRLGCAGCRCGSIYRQDGACVGMRWGKRPVCRKGRAARSGSGTRRPGPRSCRRPPCPRCPRSSHRAPCSARPRP